MAYIKPKMSVYFANNGSPIISTIEKVSFRKYWGKGKNKAGAMVRKQRSMPMACCKVLHSSDPRVGVGAEFLVAGYRLCSVTIKDKPMLAFKREYVKEYAKEHGGEWTHRIINEDR